jgi:hypothetical protein
MQCIAGARTLKISAQSADIGHGADSQDLSHVKEFTGEVPLARAAGVQLGD